MDIAIGQELKEEHIREIIGNLGDKEINIENKHIPTMNDIKSSR
jgi:hypothetical protein